MRQQIWFHPITRTGAQIAESVERQLRLWETELTTKQVVQLTAVTTVLRSVVITHNTLIQIEMTLTLNYGSSFTVEMVDRAAAELPSEAVAILNASANGWGVAAKPSGKGRVLWASVDLAGASRISGTAVRLARTPHGRALRRVLPPPLARTARRWLAA